MPTSIVIAKVYHQCCSPAQALQRRSNRCGVDVPHEFADQLFLAPQSAVRLHATRFEHGLEQFVVEIHREQVWLVHDEQLFA